MSIVMPHPILVAPNMSKNQKNGQTFRHKKPLQIAIEMLHFSIFTTHGLIM